MNTYKCFAAGRSCVVNAETSYQAQLAAVPILKPRKRYQIAVVLVAKDGEPRPVSPCELPGS